MYHDLFELTFLTLRVLQDQRENKDPQEAQVWEANKVLVDHQDQVDLVDHQ